MMLSGHSEVILTMPSLSYPPKTNRAMKEQTPLFSCWSLAVADPLHAVCGCSLFVWLDPMRERTAPASLAAANIFQPTMPCSEPESERRWLARSITPTAKADQEGGCRQAELRWAWHRGRRALSPGAAEAGSTDRTTSTAKVGPQSHLNCTTTLPHTLFD